MPPLPAAPEASGRSPRDRSGGLVASRYGKLVPPSPRGTMAVDKAQETPSLDSTGKRACDTLSPAVIAEPPSGYDSSEPRDTSLKKPEEKMEEELSDQEAAEDGDSDPWSILLPPLKVKKACVVGRDPWDEKPSELFLTSEAEETSGFSPSFSSGGTCEKRATRPSEQSAHSTVLCLETEDALEPFLHIKAEELEQLEEDILTSLDQESTLVPPNLCSWSRRCAGETKTYSQLVPPDLFEELWSLFNNRDMPFWDTHVDELLEKWKDEELCDRDAAGEGDGETECALCPTLQDIESELAASPLDSDPCYEGHSEPDLSSPEEETKMSACVWSADPPEDPNTACLDAGHDQASNAQATTCGTGVPTGASLVPAQPLACSVPSSSADMTTVPQPPAPQQWRSMVKMAQRALRRLFSFSCLRGQPEE
ncbi:unnamed protein product [Coccothraustes coccothraustes]